MLAFGVQVVKLNELSRSFFLFSLLESVPLLNLEDEIHFKGGRFVTPKNLQLLK